MLKFLNLKPEIFGIDINDLSLRIVKLKKRRSGFYLVSFNDVNIAPGIVKEGIIQDESSLVKIINMACKTVKGEKLDTKYVVVSLPEEKSFAQVIQMPRMTQEELRLAVPFEAENYIPLSIDKVYLDFQVINFGEKKSSHLDLLINVMPKPIVDSYVSCFKKVGLIPCILEVESQAMIRAFTKSNENILPTMFVDFGETKTSLIIYTDNSIRFTITIPVSSNQLTQSIADNLKISAGESERLKIHYGLENSSEKKASSLISAMSPVLHDLVKQIKKYLDFYQGHSYHEYFHSTGDIKKIILCGGGANLKQLPKFLSKNLRIPVELGDPFLNIVKNKSSLFPYKRGLSFATAIGSALRGASDTYLNSYSDND